MKSNGHGQSGPAHFARTFLDNSEKTEENILHVDHALQMTAGHQFSSTAGSGAAPWRTPESGSPDFCLLPQE